MKKHKHKGRGQRPHLNHRDSQLLQQSIAHDLAAGSAEFWERQWARYLDGLQLPDYNGSIMAFTCERCGFEMGTFAACDGHVPLTLDCCRESLTGEPCQPRTAEQETCASMMRTHPQVYEPNDERLNVGPLRFTWRRPTLAEYLTLTHPDGVEWVRRGGLLPYLNQPTDQLTEEE